MLFCFFILNIAAVLWRMSQLIALAHFSSACFYVSSRIRLILSLSLRVLCLAFLSRIYIAVASLLNGMIDILLDFYVLCPWNFSFFISLSFFLCRDLCMDIWLVGRLRRWLETKEIGPKVSFIILVFWYFIIVFVVWLFIVLSSVFMFYYASCILHLHLFYRLSGQLIIGWYGWI